MEVDGIERVFATFHDQGVDLADAALVHLASRERIQRVFTLDQRHFYVYRTNEGRPLTILPP